MSNVLLMVSLVLNGLAFFCIIILYLRQNRLLQVEKNQEKLLSEMEEVISTYLIEMTEENEKFIKKVKELVPKHEQATTMKPSAKKHSPVLKKEPDGQEIDKEEKEPLGLPKGTVYQAVQAYKNKGKIDMMDNTNVLPSLPDSPKPSKEKNFFLEDKPVEIENEKKSSDLYTQSFYYQALLLQKQGLSTEDIARRLNKGKTEIELLLKLRQNEK